MGCVGVLWNMQPHLVSIVPCSSAFLPHITFTFSIILPHTPYTPNSPTPHFSGTIFGKYKFSLRPDEAASLWRLQKLVCNKLIDLLCFSIQEIL